MTKKTKISLNSTLIEAVTQKARETQEQTLFTNSMDFQYFDTDKQNIETYDACSEYRKKAERLAQQIVDMDFKNWTEDDTWFYNAYRTEGVSCNWSGSKSMDEYIQWIMEGRPGVCDKWWHCVLPVIEIGLLFIPGIGWGLALGLSMSVGLLDAALYYSEGEEETAGLVAFLTILPGVPAVAKKFPFVKAWAKEGTEKIAGKMITGERMTMLETFQLKSLSTESAQKFLETEVKQHLRNLASKEFFGETVEIGGKKITDEMIDNAIEKGYLQVTVDGVTSNLSKEVVEALTKPGLYTAKQQSKLIKFGKAATPFIVAGLGYIKIMDELAKMGVRGPIKIIEKLWGIDPNDATDIKISNFFQKVTDPEAELDTNIKTKWDFIKFVFNSSGSEKDGELMVQAIKNGWNPFEEGKTIVPKKYRTKGYKEWVNNILSNKSLLTWFGSDGSDKDNNLLLSLMFENPSFNDVTNVPEKYRTETYKKNLQKRIQQDKAKKKSIDDEGEEYIELDFD